MAKNIGIYEVVAGMVWFWWRGYSICQFVICSNFFPWAQECLDAEIVIGKEINSLEIINGVTNMCCHGLGG